MVPGSDQFGDSVEIEEPYIYVGDWADDDGGTDAGAVYTYEYSWTSSSFLQKIVAPDAADFDHFGWDLAVSGLQLLIGSPEKDAGLVGSGAAYMYDGFFFAIPGPPTWLITQRLVACEAEEAAHFGAAVAMDGKWAVVGAWGSDPNGLLNAGRAYGFRRGTVMPDPWTLEHQLMAGDGLDGDGLGFALDLAGLFPVVGALGMDAAGMDSGGAYTFAMGRAYDVLCAGGGPVEPTIFERGPSLPK